MSRKFSKLFDDFLLKYWDLSGAKACKSCRSRQELSNEYLIAKFGIDTAENEPSKVCRRRSRGSARRPPSGPSRGRAQAQQPEPHPPRGPRAPRRLHQGHSKEANESILSNELINETIIRFRKIQDLFENFGKHFCISPLFFIFWISRNSGKFHQNWAYTYGKHCWTKWI